MEKLLSDDFYNRLIIIWMLLMTLLHILFNLLKTSYAEGLLNLFLCLLFKGEIDDLLIIGN